MSAKPAVTDLESALRAAGQAHHDYESNFLNGEADKHWAGWYAGYVLGRLGDFTSPTSLTRWLAEAPSEGDWAPAAARHVAQRL
jgi:hypothetical protein